MNVNEKQEREDRNAVEHVLSTVTGRRFLWRMISLCGVYQDINVEDQQDAAKKIGKRSMGLLLMQIIGDADQDKLFLMMKEAKSREDDIQVQLDKEAMDEDTSDAVPFISTLI